MASEALNPGSSDTFTGLAAGQSASSGSGGALVVPGPGGDSKKARKRKQDAQGAVSSTAGACMDWNRQKGKCNSQKEHCPHGKVHVCCICGKKHPAVKAKRCAAQLK